MDRGDEEVEGTQVIPPIMKHTIKLDGLTPEEEKIIKDVLTRDAKVTEMLDNRVSSIRKEIQNIRKQGALTKADNQNMMCARCKQKFWSMPIPFTDKGFRCTRCKFRVCRKCRVRQVNKTWLCSLCLKHRQVRILTGEWIATGDDNAGLYGSDLIRASFRDRGVTDEELTEIRCPTPQYVVTKAVLNKGTETESRTSVNSRTSDDEQDEGRQLNDVQAVQQTTTSDDGGPLQKTHDPVAGDDSNEADDRLPVSSSGEISVTASAEVKDGDGTPGGAQGLVHIGNALNNANFTARASDFGRITVHVRPHLEPVPARPEPVPMPVPDKTEGEPSWGVVPRGPRPPVVKKKKKKKKGKGKKSKRGKHKKGGKGKKRHGKHKKDSRKHHHGKHKRKHGRKSKNHKPKKKKRKKKKRKKKKKKKKKKQQRDSQTDLLLSVDDAGFDSTRPSLSKLPPNYSANEAAGEQEPMNKSKSNRHRYHSAGDYFVRLKPPQSSKEVHGSIPLESWIHRSIPNKSRHNYAWDFYKCDNARHPDVWQNDSLKSLSTLSNVYQQHYQESKKLPSLSTSIKISVRQASPRASLKKTNLVAKSHVPDRNPFDVPTFVLKSRQYHKLNINRSHAPTKNSGGSNALNAPARDDSRNGVPAADEAKSIDLLNQSQKTNTSIHNVGRQNRHGQSRKQKLGFFRLLLHLFISGKEVKSKETIKRESMPLRRDNNRNKCGEPDRKQKRIFHWIKSSPERQNHRAPNLPDEKTKYEKRDPPATIPGPGISRQDASYYSHPEPGLPLDIHKSRHCTHRRKNMTQREKERHDVAKSLKAKKTSDMAFNSYHPGLMRFHPRSDIIQHPISSAHSSRIFRRNSLGNAPTSTSGTFPDIGLTSVDVPEFTMASARNGAQLESDINVNFQPTRRPSIAKSYSKSRRQKKQSTLDPMGGPSQILSPMKTVSTDSKGGREPHQSLAAIIDGAFRNQSVRRSKSDDPEDKKLNYSDTDAVLSPSQLSASDHTPRADNDVTLPAKTQQKQPLHLLARLSPFHRRHRAHAGLASPSSTSSNSGTAPLTPSSSSSSLPSFFLRHLERRSPSPSLSSHSLERLGPFLPGTSTPLHWDADVSEGGNSSTFLSIDRDVARNRFRPSAARDLTVDTTNESTDEKRRGTTDQKVRNKKTRGRWEETSRMRMRGQKSDLEAFRAKAARSSSPHSRNRGPMKAMNRFELTDVVQQAAEAEKTAKAKVKAQAQIPQLKDREMNLAAPVDLPEDLHWHETLRRRSIDVELMKRRPSLWETLQGQTTVLPPLPAHDETSSLSIPPTSPSSGRSLSSPSPSVVSTSSQESISKYFENFQNTAARQQKSRPKSPKGNVDSRDSGASGIVNTSFESSPGHQDPRRSDTDAVFQFGPTTTSTPRHSSRGPHRRRRLPKTAASLSSQGRTRGQRDAGNDLTASNQRRDSYSKALENQKVKVILPKGTVVHGIPGQVALDTSSVSEAQDSGQEWDEDSFSSSSFSFSSSQPPSRDNSFHSSRSSRDSSSRCMPSANFNTGQGDGEWRRDHDQNTISGRRLPLHEQPAGDGSKGRLDSGDRTLKGSSSPSSRRRDGLEKQNEFEDQRKSRGLPSKSSAGSMNRADSFEKIYDSNVNRLVEMMTGSTMPEAQDSSSESSKQQRLLPRPPDTGKSREFWMQRNFSLSEEYSESLKYVSVDDLGLDLNDDLSSHREKDDDEPESKSKDEVKSQEPEADSISNEDTNAASSAPRGRQLPNIDNIKPHQQQLQQQHKEVGKLDCHTAEVKERHSGSRHSRILPNPVLLRPSDSSRDKKIDEKPKMSDEIETSTSKQSTQNTNSDSLNVTSRSPSHQTPIQRGMETRIQQGIQQQSALLANLRVPEKEIPPEFKSALCRHSSNASDTLSIITEISESLSFGEAGSIGGGNSSDDTLHQAPFNESLSDDDDDDVVVARPYVSVTVASPTESSTLASDSIPDHHVETDDTLSFDSSFVSEPESKKKSDDDNNPEKHSTKNQDRIQKRDSHQLNASYVRTESIDDSTIGCTSDDSGFTEHKTKAEKTESKLFKSKHVDNSNSSCHDDDDGGGVDVVKADNDETQSESSSSYVDPGSGTVTLLSMALEHEKRTHPPLRQLKVFRMLSKSMSESSTEQDDLDEGRAATSGVSSGRTSGKPVVATGGNGNPRTAKSDQDGGRDDESPPLTTSSTLSDLRYNSFDAESLRDSDSGVTSSSHASQVVTPEQRSLSNEKGVSHAHYASTDKGSVPTIAVTEEANEEEDDLDELFNKHRHDNNLLGSRTSLRDSRESLYSVYSNAEENYGNVPVSGEILFHLTYDYKHNVLAVHVKQCKEISPVDTKHNRSDPYVKTYLLPDKTRGSKRKTKIKRHTLNPVYDEVLKYSVSKGELDSRTLWVSVWNNDRFGRNDFLGEVTIPLAYYKFDHSAPIWYMLQERAAPEDTSLMTYKGDLFISLKYVPADMVDKKKAPSSKKGRSKTKADAGLGEVHVLVKMAKNLTAMRGANGSNPFCKGYLLPDKSHNSKQKTPVVKKSTSPEWQHILVFEGVDEQQLEHHGLELTIWDYEKLASNDFLGGVRVNLGLGTAKGKPADWMDAKGEEIEVWQGMMDAPNQWSDAQLPLRSSMGSQNVRK